MGLEAKLLERIDTDVSSLVGLFRRQVLLIALTVGSIMVNSSCGHVQAETRTNGEVILEILEQPQKSSPEIKKSKPPRLYWETDFDGRRGIRA